MKQPTIVLLLWLFFFTAGPLAEAHFKLLMPQSWIVENDLGGSTDAFETDIDIPNVNCPKCTLQIIEFMAEHGLNPDGGYFYHHCADIQVIADPAKPIDKRWAAAR
jgi:hypothetical protein